MRVPHIPDKTRIELASPAPPGQRHAQMVKVVCSLVGQGFALEATFQQIRSMYPADVSDSEIAKVISWAGKKNFQPCLSRMTGRGYAPAPTPSRLVLPADRIRAFLHGSCVENMTADDLDVELWEKSSWRPLEDWKVDSIMVIAGMFHAGEWVNVITEYGLDRDGKAFPKGFGLTLERDAMMRHIRDNSTPQSKAGCWFRMNPVNGKPLPDAKDWKDENITSFRFLLLELDNVPVELQLRLFARLPLPINAITLSGGKSAHAVIRVNARTAESYRAKISEVFDLLKPFGLCLGNKNPSRLSRLPGAQRIIGASGDGQQRLLYFAPDRIDCKPIL